MLTTELLDVLTERDISRITRDLDGEREARGPLFPRTWANDLNALLPTPRPVNRGRYRARARRLTQP